MFLLNGKVKDDTSLSLYETHQRNVMLFVGLIIANALINSHTHGKNLILASEIHAIASNNIVLPGCSAL